MIQPQSLPVCVLAAPALAGKARYALTELLRPLGFRPAWQRPGENAALYYGPADQAPPSGLVFAAAPATAHFFARPRSLPEMATVLQWDGEGWPVPFKLLDGTPDLIASAFFWLSGWQELARPRRDEHGRFPYAASLQAELGGDVRPFVDAYRQVLAAHLREHGLLGHSLPRSDPEWVLCPTFDIDYLRKWRLGPTGSYLQRGLKALVRGQGRVTDLLRPATDALRRLDPYAVSFRRLAAETEARGGKATFFIKAGAHGPHDAAYRIHSKAIRAWLRVLSERGHEIGIHPGYHAFLHEGYLEEEKARLMAAAGRMVATHRQHYLRFDPARSPALLQRAGVVVDSSLGFAEREGFRRGTCLPFQLYDLVADSPTSVWEAPPAFMDAALFNRRHMTPAEATARIRDLLDTARRFGGVAVGIWHNLLWDALDHPGWDQTLAAALDHAIHSGGAILSLSDALCTAGINPDGARVPVPR